jgi:hypothetical protein
MHVRHEELRLIARRNDGNYDELAYSRNDRKHESGTNNSKHHSPPDPGRFRIPSVEESEVLRK